MTIFDTDGSAVAGKVIAITGAASGIGKALAECFAAAGARALAVGDIDGPGAGVVAAQVAEAHDVHAFAATTDVCDEHQLARFIDRTEAELGPIDLFCGNAGVFVFGGPEASDSEWERIHAINVMAHVYASRLLVPRMLSRGGGTIMLTVSAAGFLGQIGSAPYSVTKHAALGLAEWLSITYGDRGLRVHALCPQAVATAMTAGIEGGGVAGIDGMLSAEAVADAALVGLTSGEMLIFPHPEVAEYARRRADDHERWLRGMRRLQAMFADFMPPDPTRPTDPTHRPDPPTRPSEPDPPTRPSEPGPVSRPNEPGPVSPTRPSRTRNAQPSPPPSPAFADASLVEVGLLEGDTVRFRRTSDERWKHATVERRERDGSVGLRDGNGAARAIPIDLLEVRTTTKRGAVTWERVAERAARSQQLRLL